MKYFLASIHHWAYQQGSDLGHIQMEAIDAILELLAEHAAEREEAVDIRFENERDARTGDVNRPLLRIASLSARRVGLFSSGCLELSGMHDAIRRILEPHYRVHMQVGHDLDRSTLEGADLLILDMCGARVGLSAHEQARLRWWVRYDGGVAILNCFSKHSRNGSYNSELVQWLGIDNPPTHLFGPRTAHVLPVDQLVERSPALEELLAGPHGTVDVFENLGSTPFWLVDHGQPAKWICRDLAYFGAGLGKNPRSCGVVGSGAALVCSNLHWLVSEEAWDGGVLESTETNSNAIFLRNIAARAAKALPWSPVRHAAAPSAVRSTVLTVLLVAKRIDNSKSTARPHRLPALPTELWLHVLQQALICELHPRQEPNYRYANMESTTPQGPLPSASASYGSTAAA